MKNSHWWFLLNLGTIRIVDEEGTGDWYRARQPNHSYEVVLFALGNELEPEFVRKEMHRMLDKAIDAIWEEHQMWENAQIPEGDLDASNK